MQSYSKKQRLGENMLYSIFILLTLPLLVLYLYYQTTQVKLEKISISSDKIKGNLKILHLSDHHFNKMGRLEKKIIAYLQKEEFDILVLTGDYLRNITYIDEFDVFLKKLNLNQPAFAVSGDNDYSINPVLWQEFFKESGIIFLANQGLSINIAENTINIIGVESPGIADDLNKSLSSLDLKDTYNIILSHTYNILEIVKEEMEIDLILVGDTHGGQINFPLIGKRLLDYLFRFDFLKGLYRLGNTYLYVNRGLGTSGLYFRLRCSPEIALIEINGS